MPKLVDATPKYCRRKASGQAIVTIHGHDFYLGPWNSKASPVRSSTTGLSASGSLPGDSFPKGSDMAHAPVQRFEKVQHLLNHRLRLSCFCVVPVDSSAEF